MLTDAALKAIKGREKAFKIKDREGLYVLVQPTGSIAFKYDYRLNGRRESITLGTYGKAGVSLFLAREKLIEAKKSVKQGISPAMEKQRERIRLKQAQNFEQFTNTWFEKSSMADSTRAMRRAIADREFKPWANRLLHEITPPDLRAMCAGIVARGAPATALHARDIVKQVYAFARLQGEGR